MDGARPSRPRRWVGDAARRAWTRGISLDATDGVPFLDNKAGLKTGSTWNNVNVNVRTTDLKGGAKLKRSCLFRRALVRLRKGAGTLKRR